MRIGRPLLAVGCPLLVVSCQLLLVGQLLVSELLQPLKLLLVLLHGQHLLVDQLRLLPLPQLLLLRLRLLGHPGLLLRLVVLLLNMRMNLRGRRLRPCHGTDEQQSQHDAETK